MMLFSNIEYTSSDVGPRIMGAILSAKGNILDLLQKIHSIKCHAKLGLCVCVCVLLLFVLLLLLLNFLFFLPSLSLSF